MSWNNRVIRQVINGETCFGIHEVYYTDEGEPHMCTADPVESFGETLKELSGVIARFWMATEKPVLEMTDFEEGGKYYTEENDVEGQ